MQKSLKKDKLLRKNIFINQIYKLVLLSISKNSKVKTSLIWNINYTIFKKLSKISNSRIRNFCFFTGRSSSLNLKLKVSRIFFFKVVKKLEFYGYRQIIW